VTLSELSQIDSEFANAVKMMVVKSHLDGKATLPMAELVGMLSRLGFSAQGQESSIKDFVIGLKNKNSDLVSDVNDKEIMLTTIPTGNQDADANADQVKKMAIKKARQELGL
jgi:hypothetical protein